MIFGPRTLRQAKRYRYGKWASFVEGYAFDPACCFARLMQVERRQCRSKPDGEDGLCAMHRKRFKIANKAETNLARERSEKESDHDRR